MAFKPSGHPLHPPATHFALALPCAGAVFDAVSIWRPVPHWPAAAFLCIAAGLAAAAAALIAGMIDSVRFGCLDEHLPARTSSLFVRHISLALLGEAAFGASLWLRAGFTAPTPPAALACSAAGAVLLLAAGWHGGELVYSAGIGVRHSPPDETAAGPGNNGA
ncbi:DUF2231 domain-containing protein [bacterium]|nr:DUF2231 domain-containing protein [bacterium]